MKLLFKVCFLFCLLSFLNVDNINASAIDNSADEESYFSTQGSYNDGCSYETQNIYFIKMVPPRSFEYNFNNGRNPQKNGSYSKYIFQAAEPCKELRGAHLGKGYIYNVVNYLRHTSKYYIYALRRILI
jgi:hypothetical protein